MGRPSTPKATCGIADSLARIGGGGSVFGDQFMTGGANPILDENRRQTSVLEEIRNSINRQGGIIAAQSGGEMTLA